MSIYNKPWLIEPGAALSLLAYIESAKQNGEFSLQKLKSYHDDDDAEQRHATQEAIRKLFAIDGVAVAPTDRYGLRDFKGFEGSKVAVIQLFGPMMKADFCGDFGTASLRQLIRQAGEAKSVETVLLFEDTPGGTVEGTEAFATDYSEVRKKKHTISFADDMMCSAGYWAGGSADMIFAGSETTIIGSIGTMMSWSDSKEYRERLGIKYHEFYATRSSDKNRIFRDAEAGTETGKKQLVEEFLDPVNNVFLRNVQGYRQGKIDLKKEDVLTGKLYYGADAMKYGLVDDIKSFEETLKIAMEVAPKKKQKTYSMSTKKDNAAFQKTLTVANAGSFEVVEGGFLLTEEHLNNIDAELSQNATTIRTLSQANERLEAEAAASDATALQEQLTTANAKVVTLEGEKATLTQQLEEAKSGADAFFGDKGQKQDKGGAHEQPGAKEKLANLPHIKQAKEDLGL
ncbi:MAG TPA: S49 family peptidase [Flavipsychrobacter sp.]|nr:S49 family peptidase [Flavipsychrobacter sp.]